MYGDDEIPLRILQTLREHGSDGLTLDKVLIQAIPEWSQGRIPVHTGAAILGNALSAMLRAGLITLSGPSSLEESVRKSGPYDENSFVSLYDGYAFSEKLAGQETAITLKIASNFATLQKLLNFSLTELVRTAGRHAVRTTPFFGKPNTSLVPDVFVLMPFETVMTPIYEDHIKKVCRSLNLICLRADDFFGSNEIVHDIWSALFNCRFVIADCTGRNANVFYEIGIAHTLGKPVLLTTQNEGDVPFDLRHIRFVQYKYTPRGMKTFEEDLTRVLKRQTLGRGF